MNGDCSKSYVRGIAAHDTYARVIAAHAVHYLLMEWNVGFRAKGHNIFLEDGVETHNIV